MRTSHFELISRDDPASTAPLVLELEWVRSVFESNFAVKSRIPRPVLVLLPGSPLEYQQMNPPAYSAGYYAARLSRDIIVLREMTNARRGLLHEYTHLILHHEGGRWPSWFNEGTATFYETMRRASEGIETGAPGAGQLDLLRQGAWIPISHLTSVESPAKLNSLDAVQRFYAQSWLYVHMLRLAPTYRGRFSEFRSLVSQGVSAEECVRRVYSMTLAQFDEDARGWSRQQRFPIEILQPPSDVPTKAATRVVGQLEFEIARATASTSDASRSQVGPNYQRLARLTGNRCDLQPHLGDLAVEADLFSDASAHYLEALRCAGDSAVLSGVSHYVIGIAQFLSQDYDGALRSFEKVSELPQAEGFRLARAKTMALANLKRFPEAEEVARTLIRLASDGDQRQLAQLTIDDVARDRLRAENPPVPRREALLRRLTRLDGELLQVDCMAGRARFWIRSGSETTRLIVDPSEVVSGPEPGAPFEFRCGTQRRAIVVGYQVQPDPTTDTVGRVRYIELP